MTKSPGILRNPLLCVGIFTLMVTGLTVSGLAQDDRTVRDRQDALDLIKANRYLDALPILERIILSFPDDANLWAQFGIAIMSNSVILGTPEARKAEYQRGLKALQRARQLGTSDDRALDLLETFENTDGTDNFSTDNPEVEKALREGEAFFGRADYRNAFKSYERAHKLDPNNYEAVLFMGDCFYAEKKYKESEPYFREAVKIDPNLQMAFRYWGDALFYQNKLPEAREKFIQAAIADPYSRLVWSSLERWAKASETEFSFYEIIPPGNRPGGVIKIDEALLRANDGTKHWKKYSRARSKHSKKAARDGDAKWSFSDEIKAWKSVTEAFRSDLKAGKIRYPDPNLVRLLRVNDDGMLQAYLLILRPYNHFGDNYEEYRKVNRARIRTFIIRYILNMEK